jgi:hypothetical protein
LPAEKLDRQTQGLVRAAHVSLVRKRFSERPIRGAAFGRVAVADQFERFPRATDRFLSGT